MLRASTRLASRKTLERGEVARTLWIAGTGTGAGRRHHRAGIWMKWFATSAASACTCGAPSMTKARSWIW
jgi:hypothetical protein